jgi:hypothetical protein
LARGSTTERRNFRQYSFACPPRSKSRHGQCNLRSPLNSSGDASLAAPQAAASGQGFSPCRSGRRLSDRDRSGARSHRKWLPNRHNRNRQRLTFRSGAAACRSPAARMRTAGHICQNGALADRQAGVRGNATEPNAQRILKFNGPLTAWLVTVPRNQN